MSKPQRGVFALFSAVLAATTLMSPAAADVANPPWPSKCPLKVGLLVDQSDSMASRFSDVREATRNVVDALRDKPSEVSLVGFGTTARVFGTAVPVANDDDRHRLKDEIDQLDTGTDVGGATNWQAALAAVQPLDLDVVVLITDGQPTTYGVPAQDDREQALPQAAAAADTLKSAGTRVVAVGIELDTSAAANLAAVTGPAVDQDYFASDTRGLLRQLYNIVASSCGVHIDALPRPEPAQFPWTDVLLYAGAVLLAIALAGLFLHLRRRTPRVQPTVPRQPRKVVAPTLAHDDLVRELRKDDPPPPARRSRSLDFLQDPKPPTTKDNP